MNTLPAVLQGLISQLLRGQTAANGPRDICKGMVSVTQAGADSAVIASVARPAAVAGDYDSLIASAGDRAFVLIGEASHGTHEFYATRADLTRRLIMEKNFRILALEADWPDMLRVHRYVTGRSEDNGAAEALGDFRRFPAWMWRNSVMVEFVEWLCQWNTRQPER